MGRKLVAWIFCVVVASIVAAPAAYAGDPTLIGWWKLDDGAGTVALDSSSYGNNGTVVNPTSGLGTGGSVWFKDPERGMVISFNGTDGTGACVTTDLTIPVMTLETDFTWVFWAKQHADQAANNDVILGNRYGGTTSPLQFIKFTPTNFEYYNGDATTFINYTDVTGGVWVHHATVKQGTTLTYYRDGVETLSITLTNAQTMAANPFYMGADGYSGVQEAWEGYLSDVRLYERALTEGEVLKAMAGQGPDAELAGEPVPEDEATDVPRDFPLSWTKGEYAATHNVYLGASFDDVNAASATNPRGVLVSQDQADTTYPLENPLEYGQTYYWRVDEVNDAPDRTLFKGNVWSFTVEPYAYPITNVTAKASAEQPISPATRTIDGSGLDEFDQHGVDLKQMWVSPSSPTWIQYTFDQEYKLHELWVWNANSELETLMGFGAKDVTIEYSTDGETWTPLENVPEFAQGTGKATYTANTIVDLGEVLARHVRLNITDNWGTLSTMVSLSEVRFYYTPTQAFEPVPADGATQVAIDTELAWRPGREATSHEVYFGTDPNALTDETVTDHRYTPESMNLGTVYYWKVNEVSGDDVYEGDVWSFSTEDSILIDGFETYDDDMEANTTIFQTWIDGYDVDENGSLVGYGTSPFAEQTIVFAGDQSMPFAYDNAAGAAYSEAERTFEETQDWTKYGVQTLSLYFLGDVANTGAGKLYVKINGAKVLYGGATTDLQIGVWQPWTIDLAATGVNLKKVTRLAIGVEGSGSAGMLFIDEIRLYPTASATVSPVDPGTTGLVAYYKLDGDAKDSAGSHHGTLTGSPGFVAGKSGQALNMTSDSQYVEVAYADDLAMSTFTVAAWINVAELDALRAILGTRIGGDYTFDVKADSTRIHGDIGNGTAWLNTSLDISTAQGGVINAGEWHHVTYVIDNASQACYMYLDGALGSTAAFSGTPMFMTSAETLGIGYCSSGEFMHGQIDEVRIYNRALSEAEVAGLVGRTGPIYIAP